MLHYILQTVAFQLFFLIIYDVFLKKETFFNWNRFYLLITAIASIVMPFIKFESIRTIVPEQFIIRLPEVIIGDVKPEVAIGAMNSPSEIISTSNFFWSWDYLLYWGMVLASFLLIYKISKISVLIQKNPKRWKDNLIIVNLLNSNAAFSFFNYVFLGEWIQEDEKGIILKHEKVHVTQKHSLDLLLFEILRIIFWFNPLIYMYQNRIQILHEYSADAQAMKQIDKKHYYEKLLCQVFETEHISFTNTFFNQSLIKKRIIMLSKSKSHRSHLLKYALLIPMVFGMLVYTSCQKENEQEQKELSLEQYSYTLKKSEKNDAQNLNRIKFETFLKNNPEFVGWADANYETSKISYSIHPKSEIVSEGFMELKVGSPDDGGTYLLYMNSPYTNTETNVAADKSDITDYSNEEEVPFSVIDEVPTTEACKGFATNDEKRQCLSEYITEFVGKNFNIKLANELGLTGKQRIIVLFKIGKDGIINVVKARAPHPALEAEAIRVIKLLPPMIPGKHRGLNVTVPYSLPISFQVND